MLVCVCVLKLYMGARRGVGIATDMYGHIWRHLSPRKIIIKCARSQKLSGPGVRRLAPLRYALNKLISRDGDKGTSFLPSRRAQVQHCKYHENKWDKMMEPLCHC